MNRDRHLGFSAVELLITLFIASAFLISGYQLYSMAIKDGGQARSQSQASNIAYDYLQRYKSSVSNPCVANTVLDQAIVASGLQNASIKVEISCPYSTMTSLSKISATVKYGNPQKTVINTTYNIAG